MERLDWVRRIKEIRATTGIGIFEAEAMALRDPKWRRWVELRINNDLGCRKSALHHMKVNGDRSLIEDRDGRLVVRDQILPVVAMDE